MPNLVAVSQEPILQFFTNSGLPLQGGTLLTQVGGVNYPSYSDSAGQSQLPNPIVLNARGEIATNVGVSCPLFVTPNVAYTYSLFDANGNPVWTAPNITSAGTTASVLAAITQSFIAQLLYPQTKAELAASITPTNLQWQELDPRRYNGIGDGVTDDTAALIQWVAVVNASTNPVSEWPTNCNFLCGPLGTITAANFIWRNGNILVKPSSWTTSTVHLTINATGSKIYATTFNGNQANFLAGTGVGLLAYALQQDAADDFLLDGVSLINSPSRGLTVTSTSYGRVVNCHFDSNVSAGAELVTVSYLKFANTTFNFNGYGFQQTLATNAFSSYAMALRFRSHHVTFVDCEFLQNGRDGALTNQGSYAIKYIGCLGWMNGDGGFTLANDSTSPGTPGDGESPYDVEYVDCESYNNWNSGLDAYCPVNNITIDGGRYYNNHRNAGQVADATSYNFGIYIAGGSNNIKVNAKCYDDRQLCAVTGTSGGAITATNWGLGNDGGSTFVATAQDYPRVALYNASLVFQGYGTITAEASGLVTIQTNSFNGVTISSITSGWFISQRVQHGGKFYDNGCQPVTCDAGENDFGHLPGIQSYYGFNVYAANTTALAGLSGCSVMLPTAQLDTTELLLNPSFDADITNWTFSTAGGGSSASYTTQGAGLIRSAGALQLVAGSSNATGGPTTITDYSAFWNLGAWVEFAGWAYCTVKGGCNINLTLPGPVPVVAEHLGRGWQFLQVCVYVPSGSATLAPQVFVSATNTAYFDTMYLRTKQVKNLNNADYSYPSRNLPV